ncbi:hypothetical protein GGI25_002583, partial [Coemansia spiralis]
MVHSSGVPLLQGLLAKAGMAKVRQISTPFNVQHDVHISVEDLDDIMQQVPEPWKAYISPTRSPMSDHRSSETHDNSDSGPSTPIYREMTAHRPYSADDDDLKLSAHLARASLAKADSADYHPGSPGWLPHIVSVSSPPDANMQAMFRKQRTVSGHSANALADSRGVRASHVSAEAMLSSAPPRSTTPTSAPITNTNDDASSAGAAHNNATLNAPDTPQSASARMWSHESDTEPANTWDRDDDADTGRETATFSGKPGSKIAQLQESERKWIKRKSRVVSTIGIAMAAKRFSKAPVTLQTMGADSDETPLPSKAEMMMLADRAAKKAAAANASSASAAGAASAQEPTASNPFRTLGSERDLEKPVSRHGDSASGKSSKKRRENYGELEEYAEGESGNVYITARKAATGKRPKGEYVAVKIVPKTAKARYRKLRTELKILRRIRSQHVVRFYEYFSIDDS